MAINHPTLEERFLAWFTREVSADDVEVVHHSGDFECNEAASFHRKYCTGCDELIRLLAEKSGVNNGEDSAYEIKFPCGSELTCLVYGLSEDNYSLILGYGLVTAEEARADEELASYWGFF